MTERNLLKNESVDNKFVSKKFVPRTVMDQQRIRVEKLMEKPLKPVIIPTSSNHNKEKKFTAIPTFVRNVMGSSAGAGSGEFHVYRHLRRKEYARQKHIQQKSKREMLDDEFQQRIEKNRSDADAKTAKKRAKRLKKKEKQKKARKNNDGKKAAVVDVEDEASQSESSSSDDEKTDSNIKYNSSTELGEQNMESKLKDSSDLDHKEPLSNNQEENVTSIQESDLSNDTKISHDEEHKLLENELKTEKDVESSTSENIEKITKNEEPNT